MIRFKSIKKLKEYLIESDPDVILYPDYEMALIGAAETFHGVVAVYNLDAVLSLLVAAGIEDLEEADEYFRFNVLGGYTSNTQPIFLNAIKN